MACTALLVGATELIIVMIADIGTFLQELHVQVYFNTTSCTLLTDYCSENFLVLGDHNQLFQLHIVYLTLEQYLGCCQVQLIT